MDYSLIIPIYNEERTLPKLLEILKKKIKKKNIEVIIINDGSDDRTDVILNSQNNFKIIKNKRNIGKGAAIKKGIKYAINKNIILIDGDLEVDINDVLKLIKQYENTNCDAFVGIRWDKNDKMGKSINALGNYIINGLFNFLYRSNLSDVLCCLKIIDKSLLKSLFIQSEGFSIEVEIMAKLLLKNKIIKEEKIYYKRRTAEQGKKLKFSDGWNIIWTMLKLRF